MDTVGLVLWATGNRANIMLHDEEFHLVIPGRWRLDQETTRSLVPGDKVELRRDVRDWKMVQPLSRENEFTRRFPGIRKPTPQTMAANIHRVIIVASATNPATPNGLIDRLLVTAALGNVPSILLINKIDLAECKRLSYLERVYQNAVDDILFTSAVTGDGISCLSDMLLSNITLFAGSSGVGKSTLLNKIDPDLDLKTGEISQATGKGRHITSSGQLHHLKPDGWVIDTPGLRECEPWGMTRIVLGRCFREFGKLAPFCRFRDCVHNQETGCAVKSAVGTDALTVERYESYLKLLQEAHPE